MSVALCILLQLPPIGNMKLLSPAISRLARLRYWRIEQWINNPIATQREVLQDLATHAQYTEIGRRYGLTKMFSVREFKKIIPIQDYNDIKPYLMATTYHQAFTSQQIAFRIVVIIHRQYILGCLIMAVG